MWRILQRERPSGFEGFHVLYGAPNPRAIIVTFKCLDIILVSNCSSRDIAVSLLRSNSRSYLVASFYHDITHNEIDIDTTGWTSLAPSIILAGDSNAHSTVWGSLEKQ